MPEPALLESAVRRTGAPLCVGIDPVRDRLPAGDDLQVIQDFGLRIVDQLADLVPAVKIQSACYERFGPDGIAVRDQLALHAREAGLIVVLDAKRGDIGVSSEHYAASAFSRPSAPADWVTISPYLGADGMQPFLEQGAFRLGPDKQSGWYGIADPSPARRANRGPCGCGHRSGIG